MKSGPTGGCPRLSMVMREILEGFAKFLGAVQGSARAALQAQAFYSLSELCNSNWEQAGPLQQPPGLS